MRKHVENINIPRIISDASVSEECQLKDYGLVIVYIDSVDSLSFISVILYHHLSGSYFTCQSSTGGNLFVYLSFKNIVYYLGKQEQQEETTCGNPKFPTLVSELKSKKKTPILGIDYITEKEAKNWISPNARKSREHARRITSKAIEEIRNTQNNIPNAQHIMSPKPTEEWHKILKSVSISDQILLIDCKKNNQESSHDTSFSTNIQEDGIIHTEYHANDENGPNSYINSDSLNTTSSG
ncbi:20728_t:CDS:2 [Rhizophagus irregularis]|nr:20728_t:CDS:2 [Rhizophagus irregularis]